LKMSPKAASNTVLSIDDVHFVVLMASASLAVMTCSPLCEQLSH